MLPAFNASACVPVCCILPWVLLRWVAVMSMRCPLMVPVLLFNSVAVSLASRPAAMVPLLVRFAVWIWVLPWLLMLPVFANWVDLIWVVFSAPLLLMVPLLLSMPLASMVTLPALAAICPALLTPTPFSVPMRVILPAYIPPKALVSMARLGAVLVFAVTWLLGVMLSFVALMLLAPVVMARLLAQMPALTLTARAKRSV